MSDSWFEGWVLEYAREHGWLHTTLHDGWHLFVHMGGPVLFRYFWKGSGVLSSETLKWMGALESAGMNAQAWSKHDKEHIEHLLGRDR